MTARLTGDPQRRTRRRAAAAFVAGLVVMASVPAIAHHVSEPTAPIQSLQLRLAQYGDTSTTLACDGTDVVTFDTLRIEAYAQVAAVPSEHFTVRLTVHSTDRAANWYALWHHQNVAPHGRLRSEIVQSQQSLGHGAHDWEVTVLVVGSESGLRFEESCPFRAA